MFLTNITIGEAAAAAGTGYGVVFIGLILLMVVILALGKVMDRKKKAQAAAEPAAPAAAPVGKPAPGSAGEVKLHDVSDRDAAMIMAIVADKMGRPLNELRFKSIKEVK